MNFCAFYLKMKIYISIKTPFIKKIRQNFYIVLIENERIVQKLAKSKCFKSEKRESNSLIKISKNCTKTAVSYLWMGSSSLSLSSSSKFHTIFCYFSGVCQPALPKLKISKFYKKKFMDTNSFIFHYSYGNHGFFSQTIRTRKWLDCSWFSGGWFSDGSNSRWNLSRNTRSGKRVLLIKYQKQKIDTFSTVQEIFCYSGFYLKLEKNGFSQRTTKLLQATTCMKLSPKSKKFFAEIVWKTSSSSTSYLMYLTKHILICFSV